jgi:enoyl-CoA hydratase/carnithine racemase
MTPFATIAYEKEGPLAVVRLARPAVMNAFSVRMRDELWEALTAVRDDPAVRALLLEGAGRGFCAGADLTEFGTAPSQAIARRVRFERDVFGLLLSLPIPTLAAVHGPCLGSGVELAAACDVRLAADDASFGMPETGWGLIAAAGGTQLLPRIVGQGRTLEILLSGRRFDAGEALAMGLVSRVVPRDALAAEARAWLTRIAQAPAPALAAAKRAVNELADLPQAQALAGEARLARLLGAGAPPALT